MRLGRDLRSSIVVIVLACGHPSPERAQTPSELPQPPATAKAIVHTRSDPTAVQLTVGPKNDVDLRAITAATPELRACADRNPDAKGKVVFAVTVDASGAVTIASIPANLGLDPAIAACALDIVRRTRFDAAARTFEIDVAVAR